ncbi:hypothetical protein BLOT_010174 [Blomia tropicalis]|nr:hypothetical protein BLOT_010174 [Blomia tropicalis]
MYCACDEVSLANVALNHWTAERAPSTIYGEADFSKQQHLSAFHCGQTMPKSNSMFKPIIDKLLAYEKTLPSIFINTEKNN